MTDKTDDPNSFGMWPIIIAVIVGVLAVFFFIMFMMSKSATEAMKLVHLGSGKMLADGTEQRLFTFEASEPFAFDGWVNLKNMQAGDRVVLTQYVKLGIDKEYGKYDGEPYVGVQDKPMVFIRPKNALYGMMVTLQQTAGPSKEFEWEFYKGVTS